MKVRFRLRDQHILIVNTILTVSSQTRSPHMRCSSECTCVGLHSSSIYHSMYSSPAVMSRQQCGSVPKALDGLHRQLRSTEEDQQPVKVSQNTHASVGRTMHAHFSVITLRQHATAALLHRVHKGWSVFTCWPRGGGLAGGGAWCTRHHAAVTQSVPPP